MVASNKDMAAPAMSVVVLISGSGSNLQALIDAQQTGELNIDIRAVFSNRADAYGLERAAQANIPTHAIDHKDFDSRASFDLALMQAMDDYQPQLVVLAGFMRILTEDFVRHYHGRMLNIHPSLLPKYQGLNTHARAIDAKDDEHGVSVHFVTEELDGGPVILQAAVDVHSDDDAKKLAERVQTQEHIIYPKVVQWFAQGRLRLDDNHAELDGQSLSQPLRLGINSPD
jgi:phosphoribosylglycinamide formyltransferase-1